MPTNSRPYLKFDFGKVSQLLSPQEIEELMEEEYKKALKNSQNLSENLQLLNMTEIESGDRSRHKLESLKANNQAYHLGKRWETVAAFSQENKELYSKLHSIKRALDCEIYSPKTADGSASNEEHDRAKSSIYTDNEGPYLLVESYKPGDLSFVIRDGKLEFSPEGMTPEKMRELFEFIDRRGLGSMLDWSMLNQPAPYTLENATPELQKIFDQTVNAVREETLNNEGAETFAQLSADNNVIDSDTLTEVPAIPSPSRNENNGSGNEAPADGGISENNTPEHNEPPVARKAAPAKTNSSQKHYDEAIASLEKYLYKNKRAGLTFFKTYESGYTVYTLFEKENRNNLEWDGLIDKKNNEMKARNECKFYVRVDDSGRLETSFSLPSGKNLNDVLADRIADVYKDAGISRIRFGPNIGDASEAALREAFGKNMLVPVGHKLTETRVAKMIKAAEGKHGENNPKVFKYKRELALQLASNIKKKSGWDFRDHPNDGDCRCCRHLIGNYAMHPFRDLWEDYGLCDHIRNVIKENDHNSGNPNGAIEIIGSVRAVKRTFDIYKAFCTASLYNDISIGETLRQCNEKDLTAEEKRQFSNYLKQVGISEDTPLHDLNEKASPSPLMQLQKILEKRCKEETKRDIEAEFIKNANSKFSAGENKETTTIRTFLTEATANIKDINNELTDNMLKPIFQPHLGKPDYNFDNVRQRMQREMPKEEQQTATPAPAKKTAYMPRKRDAHSM